MALIKNPDPRHGNPSDPAEESERVRKAYENVENWGKKYGAEFSGGVSMQYGDGRKYEVPIGNREIAQKVVSRPLPPKEEPKALPKAEPVILEQPKPKRSWFDWLCDAIFGVKP